MVVSIARHSEGCLAARFPFDREVVDAMPTVPGRRWSPAAKPGSFRTAGTKETGCSMPFIYTRKFSLSDSRDTRRDVIFDETLQALRRGPSPRPPILFLFRQILGTPIGELGEAIRAKKPIRLFRPQCSYLKAHELPKLPPIFHDPSHDLSKAATTSGPSRSLLATQRRKDFYDLYARAQPRTFWREEPDGTILRCGGLIEDQHNLPIMKADRSHISRRGKE